jgi:hypothetical protein
LWILSKLAADHKKIAMMVKQQLKLLDKFENEELVTELAKDYEVQTE